LIDLASRNGRDHPESDGTHQLSVLVSDPLPLGKLLATREIFRTLEARPIRSHRYLLLNPPGGFGTHLAST